jgi:glycerol-1-phosphate dehydrogenase [NAD(P)+]
LLWDEPFDEQVYERTRAALQRCVDHAAAIGQSTDEGLQALLDGLIESGFCMLDFNGSRPASGSEHQISHYLEMKLIREGRPAILHGTKVGVSSIIMAGLYDQLHRLSREALLDRLEAASLTPAEEHLRTIQTIYADTADKVIAEQAKFLAVTAEDFDRLKHTIADRWSAIQQIAATVPSPAQMTALLQQVGGPTDMQALGFAEAEVAEAVAHAHYLRDRFNVDKLGQIIGLSAE